METSNKQTNEAAAQLGVVDYAAALRQYSRYGRGRSMKKFCKLAREGQIELESKSGADKKPGFIEVNPNGSQSRVTAEEPMKVCEIRIRFNNGLVLSRRGGDVEEVISAIRKILSWRWCR